ncbi:putative sodium-coupled neutral amino acid transporter 10 [Bombyx mori]|uniref:Amino acid transporter transmembrane domain-containing protein n=1 Tax=Bombyx mori TaxID=7091 RepID=A0A8R2LZ08_BOMMO|nr:putative sodium-coupled neutral amino acid transporter 10 [Bombyx mori]
MGVAGQSITLANSIIGVGILAMPYCFQQCGILLATLILLTMGLVSRLCCYFLLKSALLARRRNFEFLAFHVFGPAGKMAVEIGIIGFLMGTCIAYFVVVGDLGPQIISKMLNVNQSDILRTSIMVVVSLVCVLPLGLLRNVDSLSNVSAATICFYLCLVVKVITEATSQLFEEELQNRMELWKPSGVLQCVPIFSMALFCQTQLFEIFESLPTLSLEKMNLVTKNAINICTGVYFTLGLFGYIAFCSQDISGNILMSLSPTMASDVIKLGFVMSLAFSFPLIIFPCRASLYSFLYKKVHSSHHDHMINHSIPQTTFRCITVGIIGVALVVGLLVPNIELVLGLAGSTIGVLVCVVFPAACFVNVTFKNTNERILAKGIIVLGLIIMVLGTYANLQAAEGKHERYDEKYITQEKIDKMVEDFFQKREKLEKIIPAAEGEILPDDAQKIIESNIIRESEVQPPNPVPPDSSKEKIPDIALIENKKVQEAVSDVIKVNGDKEPELHPKDVKSKLNEVKAVIDGNVMKEEIVKKIEEPKQMNENEDRLRILKQQKLIETIKKHGEEQKELVQEQKEIIDELLKNKKEEKENSNDGIKLSEVKGIADVPPGRPAGIPETHAALQNAEESPNEAKQQIDQRAAEAIKVIEEVIKPEQPKNIRNVADNVNSEHIQQNAQNANPSNNPNADIGKLKEISRIPEPIVNELNNFNRPLPVNVRSAVKQESPPQVGQGDVNKETQKQNLDDTEIKKLQEASVQKNIRTLNSDSPDVPQSYKQGMDNKNVMQNVPLALAMNDKQLKNEINNGVPKKNVEKLSNDIVDQQNPNLVPMRQKRQTIDCSNKATLRVEDRRICENLIGYPNSNDVILPEVDLNDAFVKRIPIDENVLRVGRSLKIYDERTKEMKER